MIPNTLKSTYNKLTQKGTNMEFNKDTVFAAIENGDMNLLPDTKNKDKTDKIKSAPFFKKYIDRLLSDAAELEAEPINVLPFSLFRLIDDTGNRVAYEQAYFVHRKRLIVFGLLAWLFGDEKYIREVEDAMWAICDEYTWAFPSHISGATKVRDEYPVVDKNGFIHDVPRKDENTLELFGTETAFALAEVSSLLEDKLHPKVVHRARKCAYDRVIQPFMQNICFWEDLPMNWCAVCSSNIGSAALYLIKDEPTLTLILRRVIYNLNQYLSKGFLRDGTTTEGLAYWIYGFSRFTNFADLLKTRTRGKIDLIALSENAPIVSFPEKCMLYNSIVACFADNSAKIDGVTFGLMSYLNRYFDGLPAGVWTTQTDRPYDLNYSFAVALRNFIWMDPEDTSKELPEKTYILKDGNWLVSRGKDGVAFAAKGGHNAESHNHNDVGSFIYQAGEDIFFSDLGQGEYTKQYFSETSRYDLLPTSSRGHSVPIIDGCYQVCGNGTDAENFEASVCGVIASVSMDIQNAYRINSLKLLRRKMDFDTKTGALTLNDKYMFDDGTHTVKERIVSLLNAEAVPDENKVRIIGKDRIVDIEYDPASVKPVISHEEYSNHSGIMTNTTEIDFEATASSSCEITLRISARAK